ncbi:MAG: neutral ceramidase [Myxococcota bacterium]|jgi:neutral ceramidase
MLSVTAPATTGKMTTMWMLSLAVLGCAGPDTDVAAREPAMLAAGPPVAGVAEGYLDLPISGPLGGYSYRCDYLGDYSQIGNRTSAYTEAWAVSTGAHTRQQAKALWLENGDEHLVVIKADLIYSHDVLVEAVEAALEAATGEALDGRVVVTASHTHNGIANFSEAVHFYLGGDRYNPEVSARLVTSLTDIALDAYDSRQPAAIGFSTIDDWDPDDQVYRDRRGENDTLQVWDDLPAGRWKDPTLWMLRVDTAAGDPLGMFFNFGIHGTLLEDYSPLISTDAPGGVEAAVAEEFDTPIVVGHWQGSAGDASPAGSDRELARIESVGFYAAGAIKSLWEQTPTSVDPIFLEAVSRAISQQRDEIKVSRDGAVDWYYAPYDPDAVPDDIVYDEQGEIISPIDEFNAAYGGAFCGDEPLVKAGKIGSNIYPYDGCMDVELVSWVVQGIFSLTDEEVAMPFASSLTANASAARVGPLPVYDANAGSESTEDLYLSFFPAEVTSMYTEQLERRASAELGIERALVVGYAQDHEGYFLIPEDWLVGGYEPTIAIWGPLQGEHVMEGVLGMMGDHLLTDRREAQDPQGIYQPLPSRDEPLPDSAPDIAPSAGTQATALPEGFYNPFPFDSQHDWSASVKDRPLSLSVGPDAEIPRVQGMAQLAWIGGDPGVDFPTVVLERQSDSGSWEAVTGRSGRPITSDGHDMLMLWQATPLYPYTDEQEHIWWAGWQAVGHIHDRPGVAEGTYRLHVYGQTYTGGATSWPWPVEEYELTSDPFVVTPAALSVELSGGELTAWLEAPAWGYRLIDIEGSSQVNEEEGMSGRNPVTAPLLRWVMVDSSEQEASPVAVVVDGASVMSVEVPDDAVSVTVEDAWGNYGTLTLAR